jgi:hypothetical protein
MLQADYHRYLTGGKYQETLQQKLMSGKTVYAFVLAGKQCPGGAAAILYKKSQRRLTKR